MTKKIKPEDFQPTGPLMVQPYQYDHGASIAVVHRSRGVVALIPPTNESADPDGYTATREPWDVAYAHLFATSPGLRDELHNVLRCFDRDNIPAFQSGRGGGEGVQVHITHTAATRIRAILAQAVVPELEVVTVPA